MECFYKSKLSVERGYTNRMLEFWNQRGMFDRTKEQLAGQARSILKNKRLPEDELKQIRNRVGFPEGEGQGC